MDHSNESSKKGPLGLGMSPSLSAALRAPTLIVSRFLLALALLTLTSASVVAQSSAAPVPDYLIGVGDVLQISVWKDAELAATVPVRPDGKITVPLAGELVVSGSTPADVQVRLTESFAEFVNAPAVSVVITAINSRKVFVIGEVRTSGVYDILGPTRLMQMLAMAGGLSEYAKKDQVIILRSGSAGEERLVVSIKAIESGRQPSDNVELRPGDTIIVP